MTAVVTINLHHDYFRDGLWHGVTPVADADTAALLTRFGMATSFRTGCFQLFCFGPQQGPALFRYLTQAFAASLTFHLMAEAADFASITELPAAGPNKLLFSTAGRSVDGRQLLPAIGDDASLPMRAVGSLQLMVDDLAAAIDGLELDIRLQARRTEWRYCLINRSRRRLDHPVIRGS
ncbi:MAG TPA: hypothetical protein VMH83_12195, partial [Candidatus Acidoferrum sp.]|nr:hypothetical protein [Candidatus Acidoferrum sp.]